jgi:C4-dicarboxylate-specific signal transduction histidine kinase
MKLFIQIPRRNRTLLCRLLFTVSILYVLAAIFTSREEEEEERIQEAEQEAEEVVEAAQEERKADADKSKVKYK